MNPENEESGKGYGLSATGCSGSWRVDLDEDLDGSEWRLQLDGPRISFDFVVRDLGVIRSAVEYLQAKQNRDNPLLLGYFGSNTVALHWDNEYPDRCFLIIGVDFSSTLHLTLFADDTAMLAGALQQILEELREQA
ncbi:MAG: hypothetical protein L0241_15510 [Planctomycetia bacterium]|nr:hypothetical protein [Planctomycetia bacterium]